MVLETQFTENMEVFREKLKEEFRQNFDVFRLPIFRSEAQMMAKPYEDLLKMFKTADAKPKIPRLENTDFTVETCPVREFPVLTISHKKKADSLCIYVAGGGMLKYPKPSQAKSMLSLEKETYPAENIALFGGSSGAAMVLWLMTLINMRGEGILMPGKIALH